MVMRRRDHIERMGNWENIQHPTLNAQHPMTEEKARGEVAGVGLALVGWVGMLIFIRLIMTGKDGHWRSKVPGNGPGEKSL